MKQWGRLRTTADVTISSSGEAHGQRVLRQVSAMPWNSLESYQLGHLQEDPRGRDVLSLVTGPAEVSQRIVGRSFKAKAVRYGRIGP